MAGCDLYFFCFSFYSNLPYYDWLTGLTCSFAFCPRCLHVSTLTCPTDLSVYGTLLTRDSALQVKSNSSRSTSCLGGQKSKSKVKEFTFNVHGRRRMRRGGRGGLLYDRPGFFFFFLPLFPSVYLELRRQPRCCPTCSPREK